MQHVLSKIWENGLVLANYKGVIDLICEPILSAEAKPKDLSEMKVKRADCVLSLERVPHSLGSSDGISLDDE